MRSITECRTLKTEFEQLRPEIAKIGKGEPE